MVLAVTLCDGSSSSETSPVTSLSLSTSICKTELTAPCYPTKSLEGKQILSWEFLKYPEVLRHVPLLSIQIHT